MGSGQLPMRNAASSKLGSIVEKKKTGRWDRRRRRWIPNEVSPDYRSMVLDITYDEEKGYPPFPENGWHDSDSAEYSRWPEAE